MARVGGKLSFAAGSGIVAGIFFLGFAGAGFYAAADEPNRTAALVSILCLLATLIAGLTSVVAYLVGRFGADRPGPQGFDVTVRGRDDGR